MVRRGAQGPTGNGHCLLEVEDTLQALGDLAGGLASGAQRPGGGDHRLSNGKTTSKEMLAAILSGRHRVLATKGNLNNLIGLPLTLLGLREAHTACVLEMGMNAPGEIARLTEIAAPEAGVITNVGLAHIGMMGSLEAIAGGQGRAVRRPEPGGHRGGQPGRPPAGPLRGQPALPGGELRHRLHGRCAGQGNHRYGQ